MLEVISEHICATPGTCGGKARIAGHRIRVADIVTWHERHGLSPEEILAHHPSLSLADVHAALAYYYDHMEEVRSEMADDETLARSFQETHPSPLTRKLVRHDG